MPKIGMVLPEISESKLKLAKQIGVTDVGGNRHSGAMAGCTRSVPWSG